MSRHELDRLSILAPIRDSWLSFEEKERSQKEKLEEAIIKIVCKLREDAEVERKQIKKKLDDEVEETRAAYQIKIDSLQGQHDRFVDVYIVNIIHN